MGLENRGGSLALVARTTHTSPLPLRRSGLALVLRNRALDAHHTRGFKMDTITYATILPSRYDSEARADAISRGLAPRTIGTLYDRPGAVALNLPPVLLVTLEGAPDDATEWIEMHGALRVEPVEASTPRTQARSLVLEALDSYGEEALRLANEARALVGLDGLERIASEFADAREPELSHTIRGALDALRGRGEPEESGGVYVSQAREGYDFVREGGFAGVWADES